MKDIQSIFQNLKNYFFELIPEILIVLLVISIGYLLARLVKYLVIRLFRSIGKLARRKFYHIDLTQAGSFLGISFFWLIIFSSILLVSNFLGLTILTKWFQDIANHVPNIFAAILIIFGAIILGNLLSDLLLSFGKRTGIKYSAALIRLVRFLLLIIAIIIALDQIGIEISLLKDIIDIVLASILFGTSLAFGLGARTSISNILACYYLRKRYKEGDMVRIRKTRGVIVKIDATSVILDNEIGQVTIPAKIFNESKSYLIKKD